MPLDPGEKAATQALILALVLAVRRDNDYPNVTFVKDNPWERLDTALANRAGESNGEEFLAHVGKETYTKARQRIKSAEYSGHLNFINNRAAALTSSVEDFGDAGGGEAPWEGQDPHPPLNELGRWVNNLVQEF